MKVNDPLLYVEPGKPPIGKVRRVKRLIPLALVLIVCLIGLATCIAANAQDDITFFYDRDARVERITVELKQIDAQERSLRQERKILIEERICVKAAKDKRAMNACAGGP